ncbi:alpha/beta hydrolase, partial [Blastococcus sp. SYSU D00695]
MSTSGLSSVAAWEVALLRNAVTTLGDVADRLVGWRARMEEVGRGIGTVVWEGPAADAAAASLVHVSTVVTRVSAALAQSLADAERLVAAADGAAELARAALAAASAAPVVLDEQGRLGPLPEVPLDPSLDPAVALSVQYEALVEQARAAGRAAELGAEALQAADRAALAAEDAAAVLATVGVVGGAAPVAFDDLLTIVGLEGTPPLVAPPGGPEPVARWWAALSEEQREAWIDRSPGFVGSTAGVPAWARDRANRLLMHDVLMEPGTPGHEVALATSTELLAREDAGEEVQLYEFDAANGMVALGLGDLDTADDIGVLVPGTATTVTDDLDAVADDAATVAAAALAAAPAAPRAPSPPTRR